MVRIRSRPLCRPAVFQVPRRLIILGSTGSIGTQTLEVVAHLNALHERHLHHERYVVVGLAAGRNQKLLEEQARRFNVSRTVLAGDNAGAAEDLVRSVGCDLVVAAMVGSAGLPATLAAVELGRDIAIANKETLVAAGELIVPRALRSRSRLLPVDSEHAALWQCLGVMSGTGVPPVHSPAAPPYVEHPSIRRAVLTASGGPFRTWTKAAIDAATRAQALNHPTWSMGPKVTVDSASLMNKALEVIEAHWLFSIPPDRISVLVHPQSLVHALVEFADGNILAQLAAPDMRSPIQHALSWPMPRAEGAARSLDLGSLSRLDFEPPDSARFPALGLAYRALAKGGTAGAVLNAANEAAVRRFLDAAGTPLPFGRIPEIVAAALDDLPASPLRTLGDCLAAEAAARDYVASRLH